MQLKLGQWFDSISSVVGIAIDGKLSSGVFKQGSRSNHFLSAVYYGLGLTLAQISVDSKTNEISAISDILKNLVIEGHYSHLLRKWSDKTIDVGHSRIEQRILESSKECDV